MKFIKIIIIIAVLIILSVFLIIATCKNHRHCGRRITCNSNLKQIGVGLMMYAQDNDNYFPKGDNITGLKKLIPLLNQTQVLICPKDKKRAAGKKNALQENNSSYIYLDVGCKITEIKYPAVTVIAFDKPDNDHSHVNVLYMDGHASKIKMDKDYNCEDILTTAYKGDFSVSIRKLQLEKVKAMDKKFTWKPKRGKFEIIRWIFGSILLLFGGYVSSFAITRTVINLRNQRRGIDRYVSGVPFGSLFFIGGWIITPLP
jgi:prepilin-type processing-associated H-X9-DG protein